MARLVKPEQRFLNQATQIQSNASSEILTSAGITIAQWDALETLVVAGNTDFFAAEGARAASRAATQAKDGTIALLRSTLQGYVDKFYATPAVTNADLAKLGLPPRPGTSLPTAPRQVTGFLVTANANGTAELKWKRSLNSRSTVFLIQIWSGAVWTQLSVSTKTRFIDVAANPGVPRTYRIIAQNSLGSAPPSNPYTIYGMEEGVELEVAS